MASKAWKNPGHTYWFISPTYEQAKVQYRRLVSMLYKSPEIMLKKNQTELRIKLMNMSQIVYKSGEILDNLKGETLNGVCIDEVQLQHPTLWPMVIRPMLTTTKGWAMFIGTPNGFNYFYDLYEKGKADSDWSVFNAPSTANPLFTQEEYEAAKKDMSQPQFEQEILAQFRDITSGRVYKNFGDHNLVDKNPFLQRDGDWSPYLPIIVGLDFNVTPMAWHLGQIKAGQVYWGDRIWLENSDTAEATEALVSKVRGHLPGVLLVGDATGKARRTSAAGKTDYDIIHETLKRNNIKYQDMTPTENPLVKDRVNTVNARLRSASGEVSVFINRNLKELIKDCQRVVWKVGSDAAIDKTDKSLTHASDSIGYPICVLMPLKTIGDVGGLWVMNK